MPLSDFDRDLPPDPALVIRVRAFFLLIWQRYKFVHDDRKIFQKAAGWSDTDMSRWSTPLTRAQQFIQNNGSNLRKKIINSQDTATSRLLAALSHEGTNSSYSAKGED